MKGKQKTKKTILAGFIILVGILLCAALLINIMDDQMNPWKWVLNGSICLLIILVVILSMRKEDQIYGVLKDLWTNRKLILQLSRNDFKTRYAGSFMGIFWAFVQPVITIFIYWFVFDMGLRAGRQAMGNVSIPFVLFLVSGVVPWIFFADSWPNGTVSLLSYSYLVKKVVFKINILPVVKVISSIFVHLFFMALAVVVFWLYGYAPDIYIVQIFYYSFATFVLSLGLSYITASLVVFIRDLSEIISILLQILIWATPIMWNIETVIESPVLRTIFKLNPMFYVVSGYRDAFVYKTWFWERPVLTVWFWFVALVLLGIGLLIFKRLKKHFADVL